MKRLSIALFAAFLLFGCAHQGLEQTGAWTPASPAAGIQARYLDDAVRTNNAAIDAVFGDLLDAGAAVTSTAAELNLLDGATLAVASVTATAAELNILDGATLSVAELNILDGVTASTAELNILDGATLSVAELNILDGATLSVAELNILDGVTSSTAELNILDGVTATATEINEVADGAAHTSFSPGGDLTGTVYVARAGGLVIAQWAGLTHSSDHLVSSATGAVPSAYRPVTTASSVYYASGNTLYHVQVSAAGTMSFQYFDYAGSTVAKTSTQSGCVSWVLP